MSQLPVELVTLIKQVLDPQTLVPDFAALQARLVDAQNAPEAWNWIASALSDQEIDGYVRFWGSHALVHKLDRDFASLPGDSRRFLRSSLLQWLAIACHRAYEVESASSGAERIVSRKLASALAALAIYSRDDNEWPEWIGETVAALSSTNGAQQGLFETLTEIAKEEREVPKKQGSKGLRRGPTPALDDPTLAAVDLVNLLTPTLSAHHPACPSALRCIAALLNKELMTQETLAALYPLLKTLLIQNSTMELSASIVEDCLIKCTSLKGFMTKDMVDRLAIDFASSLSQAFAQLPNDDATETVPLPLIKLFVTLLEAVILAGASDWLAQPVARVLLEDLIHLSITAGRFGLDEEESIVGFPLWLLLQEEAASAGLREGCAQVTSWTTLHDSFAHLWPSLVHKIRLGEFEDWMGLPRDIRERFEAYRREAAEVFLASYWVLRDEMLKALVGACIVERSQDTVEALLFVLAKVTTAIFSHLKQQPSSSAYKRFFSDFRFGSTNYLPRVNAELELLGACARWLNSNSSHLAPALNYLVECLQRPASAHAASGALQQLCKHCSSQLAQHLDSFAGLIVSSYGHLAAEEFSALVGAIGSILESLRTESAGRAALSIGFELLEQLLSDIARAPQLQPNDRLYGLEAFCAFSRSLAHSDIDLFDLDAEESEAATIDPFTVAPNPAVMDIRRRLVEALGQLAQFVNVTNQVGRLQDLENLCMALTSSSTPTILSVDSLDVLQTSAACASQSLWLLLAGRLVKRIPRDGTIRGERLQRVAFVNQLICQRTLASGLADVPDMLQAFLLFERDVLQSAPSVFSQLPEVVDALVQVAIQAMECAERPTVRAGVELVSSMLLEEAIDLTRAVSTRSPAIISVALVRCWENKQDCALVAEVIQCMVNKMPDLARASLIGLLGDSYPALSDAEKNRLVRGILQARTIKTCIQALEEFVTPSKT